MNIGQMRQFLRDVMEVEAEDWPDSIVDASLREGYERIARREQRWPFYEARWTFVASPGVATYDLSVVGDDVREITAMRTTGGPIGFTDEDDAMARWQGGTATGEPVEFSRWGSTVTLWPTPSAAETVSVRGYREPQAFQSLSGWEPDIPSGFHSLLTDWALANEYQRQDDVEMLTAYRNKYEDQLASLRKGSMATPTPAPLVVGGDGMRSRSPWWR